MHHLTFRQRSPPCICAPSCSQRRLAPSRRRRPQTPPAGIPSPLALSAIPGTPAGEALRAWIDAFNSADSTRIAAFLRTYESDVPVNNLLAFRRSTGGFDLLSIERSAPRHIEFFRAGARRPHDRGG